MNRIVAGVLAFVLATQTVRSDDKAIIPDFSHYTQTGAFQTFIDWQTKDSAWEGQKSVLRISVFLGGDKTVLQYSVYESGLDIDVRAAYQDALEASHRKELSKDDLGRLKSALKEMPAVDVYPPIERLVIVSYRDGANWKTHTYDSHALSPTMHQIYQIIGERFETKKNP